MQRRLGDDELPPFRRDAQCRLAIGDEVLQLRLAGD